MKQDNFCCGSIRQGNFCNVCGEKLSSQKNDVIQDLKYLKNKVFFSENACIIQKAIDWINRAEIKPLDTTA